MNDQPGLFDQMSEITAHEHSLAGRASIKAATRGLVVSSARLCQCGSIHNHVSVMDIATRRMSAFRMADSELSQAPDKVRDTPASLAISCAEALWDWAYDRLT